jgi:hypothetical protein
MICKGTFIKSAKDDDCRDMGRSELVLRQLFGNLEEIVIFVVELLADLLESVDHLRSQRRYAFPDARVFAGEKVMNDGDEELDAIGSEVEGEVLDLLGEDHQEFLFAFGQFSLNRSYPSKKARRPSSSCPSPVPWPPP